MTFYGTSVAYRGRLTFVSDGAAWKIMEAERVLSYSLGAWNMNDAPSIDIAHGFIAADWIRVIGVTFQIRKDADAGAERNLSGGGGQGATSAIQIWVDSIDATNIRLRRLTSGEFDTGDYEVDTPRGNLRVRLANFLSV
jgi:hypothetical protein